MLARVTQRRHCSVPQGFRNEQRVGGKRRRSPAQNRAQEEWQVGADESKEGRDPVGGDKGGCVLLVDNTGGSWLPFLSSLLLI